MGPRRLLTLLVEGGVVVVVTALVLGSVLGQPVLLGYVTSDSMAPTLEPGDGFVALPPAVTGEVEPGDVITFRAEELEGGGLTTHRVVRETEQGYITRGDGNPFTDQDGAEPPVRGPQIVAVAVQVGGQALVVPELGTVVTTVQGTVAAVQRSLAGLLGTGIFRGTGGLAYLLFALSLLGYVVDIVRGGRRRDQDRDRSRETGTDVRLVVGAFALLVVLGTTAAMVVPAGTQEYSVVSADFDSPGPGVIRAGESETTTYVTGNPGVLPVAVFLEPGGDGVGVSPRELRLPRGGVANTTVTLRAPTETGVYRRYVTEHRYLAVLPPSHLRALHEAHPWLPVVVIDTLVGVPFYVLGVRLTGTGRVRTRDRAVSATVALRRRLRRLYR